MKVSEEFPSKYLKSSDLNGKEPVLKINSVTKEEVGKEKQKKMVIYFAGKQKGMVLNKTNSEKMAYKFGDDTDDWAGQSVQLYTELVQFQGQKHEGLRLRPSVATELNDEIPF